MKTLRAPFCGCFQKFSLGPKTYDKKYGMKRCTKFFTVSESVDCPPARHENVISSYTPNEGSFSTAS